MDARGAGRGVDPRCSWPGEAAARQWLGGVETMAETVTGAISAGPARGCPAPRQLPGARPRVDVVAAQEEVELLRHAGRSAGAGRVDPQRGSGCPSRRPFGRRGRGEGRSSGTRTAPSGSSRWTPATAASSQTPVPGMEGSTVTRRPVWTRASARGGGGCLALAGERSTTWRRRWRPRLRLGSRLVLGRFGVRYGVLGCGGRGARWSCLEAGTSSSCRINTYLARMDAKTPRARAARRTRDGG